jgi:hypothetical protein
MNDPATWRAALGRRATLRLRRHDDPSHPFTEAIGVVQSVADDSFVIVDRRGTARTIPLADVVAAKLL